MYFAYYGYQCVYLKPFDNFPMTKHVETVVLLSHKKPDGHINVKVEFGEGEEKFRLIISLKERKVTSPKSE